MKWKKTKIKFFESNKCQISSTLYVPNKLKGKSFLRVVFIRTKKTNITSSDKRHYRYYAIVTDMPESQMSDEEVINFYRGRANAENFIKDLKYGMDFLHFPCQSMKKNMATSAQLASTVEIQIINFLKRRLGGLSRSPCEMV